MGDGNGDRLARAFIDSLPAEAIVRISRLREDDIVTYESVSMPITRSYRDELLASGRGVEDD